MGIRPRAGRASGRAALLAAPLLAAVVLAPAGCGERRSSGTAGGAASIALGPKPESPLPDPSGWGPHVLALAVAPDGAVWVGTYEDGLWISRDGTGREWQHITAADSGSISWDFVNAIAFAPGEAWIGTVGNGWGVSRDGGRRWRNWTFRDLGPRWQYVAPDGIRTLGDTVYIATADGLRITTDDGDTWREVTDRNGLPAKYLLAIDVRPQAGRSAGPRVRVAHMRGGSKSRDGGRTWETMAELGGEETRAALAAGPGGPLSLLRSGIRPEVCARSDLTRRICEWQGWFRRYPDPGGPTIGPSEREHFWFRRPVSERDNPRLDQTYTYGSTMGGNFQQHQGVEFNVPEGTPIHAIGDGIVAFAGEAEGGSRTVVIRHHRRLEDASVWSAYYHNSELRVAAGDSVAAGDVIALAGNTGRATNDHLHLEIHVVPAHRLETLAEVVNPAQRYPPYTRNPQLWIEPLPGTGAIAGRVVDAEGRPVPEARVYGVTKPEPIETPFSFAESYGDRAHPDPVFEENFAIGDVPAGVYVLGVEIEGRRVFRKVRVEAGKVTEIVLGL